MKTLKIMMMVLSLSVMYQFANAQNCQPDKVKMSKGWKGQCGCHCANKCVLPADTQTYINNGWYVGECHDVGKLCCSNWIRLSEEENAAETSLTDIYPNPVSGSATVFFIVSQTQKVSFKLFDMTGRLVATVKEEIFEAGENEFVWNASDVNDGIYFLKMETAGYGAVSKISVLK
jgi:hypothetical protein